jgi:hypothetical protein
MEDNFFVLDGRKRKKVFVLLCQWVGMLELLTAFSSCYSCKSTRVLSMIYCWKDFTGIWDEFFSCLHEKLRFFIRLWAYFNLKILIYQNPVILC